MYTLAVSPERVIPLGHRVLVRRDETPEKSRGGILIPENRQVIPRQGVVIALGLGKLDDDGQRIPITEVEVGQRVLFDYRQCKNVDQDLGGSDDSNSGTHYVILPVDAILAVEEDSDAPPLSAHQ